MAELVAEDQQEEPLASELGLGGMRAAARLRAQREARKRAEKMQTVEEDDPGGDDVGDD